MIIPTQEQQWEWPIDEWRSDVAQGDTKLGYYEWVAHQIECAEPMPSETATDEAREGYPPLA